MKYKNGFTIIEILLVAMIIAFVGLAGTFAVLTSFQKAKKETFLTDTKTVVSECGKLFSAEYLKGNILKIISTDSDQKALELTNSNLKYCVNLNEDGEIVNYKISNGEYYVEGEKKEQLISKNVKYGNFVDKINCNYELSDSDLLKEEVLSIEVNSKTMKIIEICGGIFIAIMILFFLFRSKNER